MRKTGQGASVREEGIRGWAYVISGNVDEVVALKLIFDCSAHRQMRLAMRRHRTSISVDVPGHDGATVTLECTSTQLNSHRQNVLDASLTDGVKAALVKRLSLHPREARAVAWEAASAGFESLAATISAHPNLRRALGNPRRMRLSFIKSSVYPASLDTRPVGEAADQWNRRIDAMLASPGDRRVVEDLRRKLRSNGDFDQPVIIRSNRAEEGHHRIAAALLEGAIDIGVVSENLGVEKYIQLDFVIASGNATKNELHRYATFHLVSLPVGDGWALSDALYFGADGCFHGVWECPDEPAFELVRAVQDRCAEDGVAFELRDLRLPSCGQLETDSGIAL